MPNGFGKKKMYQCNRKRLLQIGVIEKNLRNIKLINEYFKNYRQRKEEGRAPRD